MRKVTGHSSFHGPDKNGDQFVNGKVLSDKLMAQLVKNMTVELSHHAEDYILGGGRPSPSRQYHKRCTRCEIGKPCPKCKGRGWFRI